MKLALASCVAVLLAAPALAHGGMSPPPPPPPPPPPSYSNVYNTNTNANTNSNYNTNNNFNASNSYSNAAASSNSNASNSANNATSAVANNNATNNANNASNASANNSSNNASNANNSASNSASNSGNASNKVSNTTNVNNTSPDHVSIRQANVPDVLMPGLTAGANPCSGSATLGGSGVGFGFGLGKTIRDKNCEVRNTAALLTGMGYTEAARQLLCQDERVRRAFGDAGMPCTMMHVAYAPPPPPPHYGAPAVPPLVTHKVKPRAATPLPPMEK